MLYFPLSSEKWEPSVCCLPTWSSFSKTNFRLGCQRDNANSTGSMTSFWLWEEVKCIHSDLSANFDIATDCWWSANRLQQHWQYMTPITPITHLKQDLKCRQQMLFFSQSHKCTEFCRSMQVPSLHFCCYKWSPEEIIQDPCPYIACRTSIL